MSRRSPRPIAHALEQLRGRIAPRTTLAQVQAIWEEVVGAAVAAEARPVSERGGLLTVACSSSVWASELTMMSAQISSSLNARMDAEAITQLRCTVR